MYEIVRDYNKTEYFYKAKNCMNQSLVFEVFIIELNEFSKSAIWNITFYICNKRKHGYQSNKITGKDGIKSLLWAKKCLLDFIEYAKTEFPKDSILIH